MRLITRILLLLVSLATTFSYAQTLHAFQHIIVIVQENRTPDNLFGGNPTFEAGVDLQQAPINAGQWCLGACFDPSHTHLAWEKIWAPGMGQSSMCNGGKSSCTNQDSSCPSNTTCNGHVVSTPNNAQETYVSTTYDNSVVGPYFDIATKYGWANYMFQTNQGPSFPAHQFLFTGTSSNSGDPTRQNDYYNDFVADNPRYQDDLGCAGRTDNTVMQVDQNGHESGNGGPPAIFPCFQHATLASLLDANGISWKYYGSSAKNNGNDLWTAPNAIESICLPTDSLISMCSGTEWVNNVVLDSSKILTDVGAGNSGACNLRKVSWVIPNGDRSDHPGFITQGGSSTDIEHGPAWVADVINAIGYSPCTDTINGQQVPYWQDTAIFVTWDDFGGFWDHIDPNLPGGPGVKINNPPKQTCDSTTTFGCGDTYGFRVPLLVVSAYTGTLSGAHYAGYVSGACGGSGLPNCPNLNPPYVHDFGSILAFIENNFNLGIGNINAANNYLFADAFAPEWTAKNRSIPLADFFTLTAPRPFQQIVLPPAWQSYDANYFINYTGPLLDPDDDAIDND